MRIVFTCDTMGGGGAERVISALSNSFSKSGHNVSIVMVSYWKKESYYQLENNINLIPLINENEKSLNIFKKAKRLKKCILSLNPDIVISFISFVCIYTWFALRNTKIPYIVSERNDPNQRSKIKQLLLNLSFKKAKGCVFQTEDAKKWYKKIVNNKQTIILNPVTLTTKIDNKISNRNNDIISVGRLFDQKNYFLLLNAFNEFSKEYPDYFLKIFGDGPLKDDLQHHIDELGLKNAKLMSSSKEWQKEAINSRIFVLSSKYEGMPNVLEEALCLGIPSVSTDCTIGGPKELKKIFPDLLLLAKNNDVQDLKEKMVEALDIESSVSRVPDCLTIDNIAKQWIDFIELVLK